MSGLRSASPHRLLLSKNSGNPSCAQEIWVFSSSLDELKVLVPLGGGGGGGGLFCLLFSVELLRLSHLATSRYEPLSKKKRAKSPGILIFIGQDAET